MNYLKIITAAIFVVFLGLISACKTETIIRYQQVPVTIHKVEQPNPLVLKPVEFRVITHQDDVVLMLDFKDYENLSTNMSYITEYIENQISIIKYYENMIDLNSIEKGNEIDKLP